MSYDVTFIPKRADQTWDDALRANEARVVADGEPRPLDDETRSRYERIMERIRLLEPALERSEGPEFFQLADEETGIQVSLYATEAGISSPYWHDDGSAEAVISRMRAIAVIIEDETGWQGYDPQVDARFVDADAAGSAREMSRITGFARGLARQGEKRPWWRFW